MLEVPAGGIELHPLGADDHVEDTGRAGGEDRSLQPEGRHLAPGQVIDHGLQLHLDASVTAGQDGIARSILHHPARLKELEAGGEQPPPPGAPDPEVARIDPGEGGRRPKRPQKDDGTREGHLSIPGVGAKPW